MALGIPLVWTDAHRLHDVREDTWIGVSLPADEVPERAAVIRDALVEAGAREVEAQEHPDDAVLAVHSPELVRFLANAWEDWESDGMLEDPRQDRVVAYIFPTPGLTAGLAPREPQAVSARTGFYCFDTTTALGRNTWRAARAAVDCALTAADLVLAGEAAAYACCRPPGHHVTRTAYGGSCFLNNAAVAAQHLRTEGVSRVAVVDVDAHQGNGTQQVFYEDGSVLTCSVHVDPAAGWFPHFVGFAEERGAGQGEDANLNVPVDPGSRDRTWLAAIARTLDAVKAHGSEALVVSLGVDAAAEDPESPLEITLAGYREAGRLLGGLRLPTVLVQEGGYHLASLGGLVLAALEGIEEGMHA